MFDQGAAALRSLGASDGIYACPLCGRLFDASALTNELNASQFLTLEHAPPKSMGGRSIALTCNQCNNSAGSMIDHHLPAMAAFENTVKSFLGKIPGDHGEVILKFGEIAIRTRLAVDEGVTNFHILKHNNNPGDIGKLIDYLPKMRGGESLEITIISRASRAGVAKAHVKSAFLIAFAKLGYSFALNENAAWIREAILTSSEFDFKDFILPETMQLERGIYFVQNKGILIVSSMQRLVALPMPGVDAIRFFSDLSEMLSGKISMIMTSFPEGIEALYDKMMPRRFSIRF